MEASLEVKQIPDQDMLHSDEAEDLSECFCSKMKLGHDDIKDEEEHEEEEESEDDDAEEDKEGEEEFSFMFEGSVPSPTAADQLFIDGQIKPVFPLFNQDLLISDDDHAKILHENLPMKPPVNNVFVETHDGMVVQVTSCPPENDEIAGPYCDWSSKKPVEVSTGDACKKCNSTGFSKIWRFKDLMGRSNSDGRDAFVFLNKSGAAPSPQPPSTAEAVAVTVKREEEKKQSTTTNVKVKKSKKSKPASAHEVYLKNKAKEARPRSYLPYRPELMGIFTSVNGGLTRNVHPY